MSGATISRRVLVIAAEAAAQQLRSEVGAWFEVDVAHSADHALAAIRERLYDVALLHEGMLDTHGPDLLSRVRDAKASLVVVTLHAASGDRDHRRAAGAFESLAERDSPTSKRAALVRAAEHADLRREVHRLRGEVSKAGACARGPAAETSQAVCRLHSLLERVAGSSANVLIVGERGNGKQALARAIHRLGSRGDRPFVSVDCAAHTEVELAAVLFGHERAACATAGVARRGRLRAAHRGTLYLGHVGALPRTLQEELHRALVEHTVVPVGGEHPVGVEVRVIASTGRDPKTMVADGSFREDLYWLLASLPVEVPPLRQRLQDVPRLTAGILGARGCAVASALAPPLTQQIGISENALARLCGYDWPGNARELESVLQLASILCERGTIRCRDLDAAGFGSTRAVSPGQGPVASVAAPAADLPVADAARGRPLKAVVDDCVRSVERRAIVDALARSDGSPTRAAKLLGISRASIYNKIRDYGIRI